MELPSVRHFLVCMGMEYDWNEPAAPYCLRNVLLFYEPPTGSKYPFVMTDLWLFALIDGTGTHELWVDVAYRSDEVDFDDENVTETVATYGPFVVHLGDMQSSTPRGWHLLAVPFPEPGWYEFRVMEDHQVLAVEPVYLQEM